MSRSGGRLAWRGRAERLVLAALLLVLKAGSVRAEEPMDPSCAPPVGGAPAGKKLSKKEKKQLAQSVEQARIAYEAHKFEDAAKALRAVYLLDPQEPVLYNLAQACRESGRLVQSLTLYELVQGQTKDEATRTDAARHVQELRAKLAQREDARAAQLAAGQDFAGAAVAWESAYTFRPDPLYLFRRAQVQAKAGQTASALALYQRFLETAPQSDKAAEARDRIAELRATEKDERATKLAEEGKHQEAAAA